MKRRARISSAPPFPCPCLLTLSLFLLSFFLASSLFLSSAHAATQTTFTTSLTTSGVTSAPPSVPAGLAADAVSDSEIDLTWDASASGGVYAIAGYRIFRDSAFLATTTETSYADTGLEASTTYSYTVEAFDAGLQLSGQSAPAYATTTAAPAPGQGQNQAGGSGGSVQLSISNVQVAPQAGQAAVSFTTSLPTGASVAWGETAALESGALQDAALSESHSFTLSGLEPGMTYHVHITATDSAGFTATYDLLFAAAGAAIVPLPNPSGFAATAFAASVPPAAPAPAHIALTWANPSDPRFDSVQVVRSETFFPTDETDGMPVYEGAGQSFDDTGVAAGKTYYYAIFARAADGSFSSGALASARISIPGQPATTTPANPFASIPQAANVDPMIKALTLADFQFIQEGQVLPTVNGATVAINGSEELTIRIPYAKLPEVLKTIALTLTDPSDPGKVFPFLLRVNADKTYYEATLAPLGRTGTYAMSIVILDYQDQGLKTIAGSLQALAFSALPPGGAAGNSEAVGLAVLLFIILVILAIIWVVRRRSAASAPSSAPGA